MESFKKLKLSDAFVKAIHELGFSTPTEIQEKAIPSVIEGKDIIAQSATGSGKTLAFGAGLIENLSPKNGIQALVLTPTRELAEQVAQTLRLFSKYKSLQVVEVYGGVSIEPQIHRLSSADIVVGTPGRILDHLLRETINFEYLKILVLDEADRMLDMGFIDDMKKIIGQCPRERQTMLFSATISPDIAHIGKLYLRNPVFIAVESYIDASKLQQNFYDVPQNLKFSLLIQLLQHEHSGLIMVFCNTRRNVDFLTRNIHRYKMNALAIHGGLSQNKRSNVLDTFHSHEVTILVCTDVAARGLDIPNVSHIYNYDIPKSSTDYIHRIGRTARAGKEGMAISLVSPRDYENFANVLRDEVLKIQRIELPEIQSVYVHFHEKSYDSQRRFSSNNSRRPFHNGQRSFRPSRTSSNNRSPSSGFRRTSDNRSNSGSYRRGSSFGRTRRY